MHKILELSLQALVTNHSVLLHIEMKNIMSLGVKKNQKLALLKNHHKVGTYHFWKSHHHLVLKRRADLYLTKTAK